MLQCNEMQNKVQVLVSDMCDMPTGFTWNAMGACSRLAIAGEHSPFASVGVESLAGVAVSMAQYTGNTVSLRANTYRHLNLKPSCESLGETTSSRPR